MADSTDAPYRTRYNNRPSDVSVREDAAEERDEEDGMMSIRLPIASSGEVRNEGDEPLTRAELKGMSQQVSDLQTGVFPDHGQSRIVPGASQYSQFEKLGYWSDAEIEAEAAADGEDLLMATARMPDPETLPAATGEYRQMLAILKEQAKRGIPIDASIGWREDEDSPGGVDLMEASMVGIGADPRTSTEGGEALARAAEAADADVTGFLERTREILAEHDTMTDDDTAEDGGTTEQHDADAEESADADTEPDTDGREDDGDEEEDDEERTCPECDHDVGADANYCAECGEDLREDDEEEDGDDDEEPDDEQEGDHDDEDDDEEQDVNTSDADTSDSDASEAETDALRDEIDDLRSELSEVRSAIESGDTDGLDVDRSEEEQRDADDTDAESGGDSLRAEWLTSE